MKRFSEIQTRSKVKRIYEQEEVKSNLPSNYQDLSKDELLNLLRGGKSEKSEEPKEKENQEKESQVSKGGDIVKLFSKLFESREMAHIYHLTVKGEPGSHAAHKALQEYYEGILEFIDEIIEVYQGQYGIIEGYETIDTSETKSKEKIAYFEELVETVKTERKCVKDEDTHLHNIIDEMIALIYKTLYKLKYNK